MWRKKIVFYNIIFVFAFLADRLTKWLANTYWNQEGFFVIDNFWETKLYQNYYLSFSIPLRYPISLLITLPVLLLVIYLLLRAYQKKKIILLSAFSLVTIGAISNLIDRVRYGYVIDFINWNFGFLGNPSFNIADAYIFLGIVIIIFGYLLRKKSTG
ncbi:MAG: signal peptidase II [Patescibacteria group bacterium]